MMTTLLLPLCVTGAFTLSCWGSGRVVMRAIGLADGSLGLRIATEFVLGLAVFGAVLTALGLVGQLRPVPVLILMAVGIAGLIPSKVDMRHAIGRWAEVWGEWRTAGATAQALAVLNAALIIGYAAAALVRPPSGDAEAFYITYPKIMAATGWLEPMPGGYAAFSSIGLALELHYAALMALSGTAAAKFLLWPLGIACALLLSAIVGACGGGRLARTLAVTVLFTSQTFTLYLTDGKVDHVSTALGLAACAWVLTMRGEQLGREAALIGFLAGAAAVSKFTYIPTLGLTLAVLVLWKLHAITTDRSSVWRALAHFGSIAAAAASSAWLPQLVKNAVFFGAPLAPFIGLSPDSQWLEQVWFSPEVTRHIVLTYPFALVFGRYPMQGGGLSFLLLAFAPLVLFLPRWRRMTPLTIATLAALAGTLVWVALRPSVIAPRYYLATLLLFVPVVACAAEAAWTSARNTAFVRLGMIGAVLAAVAASAWHVAPIPRALALHFAGQASACTLASEHCGPMQIVNARAGPGARVLLADYYGYWLRPDLLQCVPSRPELVSLEASSDLLGTLQRGGFQFVIVDGAVYQPLLNQMRELARSPGGPVELARDRQVYVFSVPAGGATPQSTCREITPGRWRVQP